MTVAAAAGWFLLAAGAALVSGVRAVPRRPAGRYRLPRSSSASSAGREQRRRTVAPSRRQAGWTPGRGLESAGHGRACPAPDT